jgi:GT2 family glycosyltransferase
LKLSVIVVTWNSAADIEPCLDSINFGQEFEVTVTDNASQDDTLKRLAQWHDLTVIQNPTNSGYAHANNQGLAGASGEYVLLLNPDTVIDLGALDLLSDCLDANPHAAAAAPRLVNPDGTNQDSMRSLPTTIDIFWDVTGLSRLFPKNRTFGRWRMRWFDFDRSQEVEQPMASCLMFRRSVLVELGGLDERFPIFYNDVDLSRRLRDRGWTTLYVPEARVTHKRGASTGQVRSKMIWETHRSLFRYLRKYDRSGWFWLKAVWLLPALELAALGRVLTLRLFRR